MLTDDIIRNAIRAVTQVNLTLQRTERTVLVEVDSDPKRPYMCHLIGPLADPTNWDVRVWVTRRYLDGRIEYQIIVQDRDDDVFLNSNAMGAEKYDVRPVVVQHANR